MSLHHTPADVLEATASALAEAPPALTHAAPCAPSLGASSKASTPTLQESVVALLDRAMQHVHSRDALAAFRLLTTPLSALWSRARATGQAGEMRGWCLAHPIYALVRHDPFTHRAATKPRGYAGDAVLMDFIYSCQPPEGTSEIGLHVFAATTRAGMPLSVSYRRALLRGLIDETAATVADARMLSVASGHARELDGSLVATPWFTGEFVALDQDDLSCAEVARSMQGWRVKTVNQGVRELMSHNGKLAGELGSFDFIYSAGLYDYLPDVAAKRLTKKLLAMLRPGGRLLVANFVPTSADRAYSEIFMDWTLILRSESQMREMAEAAGGEVVNSFLDQYRNVAYVELHSGVAQSS